MLAKRIIPCLDIKNGETVKGVNFENLKYAGDPIELAKKYYGVVFVVVCVKIGGICEYLKSILAENGILNTKLLGFEDKFFSHGTRDEILEAAGLSVNHIKRAIKQCAK